MAKIEQDDLAHILRSIHWNKAKAKHIREAGRMVLTRFRGVIPRRKVHLLALPGVGPVLGDILANVYEFWKSDDAADTALRAPGAAAAKEGAIGDNSGNSSDIRSSVGGAGGWGGGGDRGGGGAGAGAGAGAGWRSGGGGG
ncbi:unnamed protein product, partial [Laminaria digitata]